MPPSSQQINQPVLPPGAVWLLLCGLLLFTVPLFVCSPVTSDTSLFDVQAMTVQKGGVLYRDMVEPNLPGVVWIHLALRSFVGWSSEAIRAADLVILSVTLLVLTQVVQRCRKTTDPKPSVGLFLLTCSLFYVTRNEWCHCQRDTWMLLPVSVALLIRFRRPASNRVSAVLEGVAWGAAFWIKPHVAIPAIAVIIVDSVRCGDLRNRLTDAGFVVVGGLAAAVPGIIWLIATGAWEHFWKMMLEWNPEYLETGRSRHSIERLHFMLRRFYPWWLIHLVAVPAAVDTLLRRPVDRRRSPDERSESDLSAALSACYLAWLAQTFLLQHAMDYIHVPEVILGICVLASRPWRRNLAVRRFAVGSLLLLAVLAMPQFDRGRPHVWSQCLTEGSTPKVRRTLAQGNFPNWQSLDEVKSFLAAADVADGDVTCTNVHSVHLFKELKVLPASRYWSVNCLLTMYPSRYTQIMAAVADSPHRFVVLEETETAHQGQILPKTFPRQYPIVFESGTYRIYRVQPAGDVAANGNPIICRKRRECAN